MTYLVYYRTPCFIDLSATQGIFWRFAITWKIMSKGDWKGKWPWDRYERFSRCLRLLTSATGTSIWREDLVAICVRVHGFCPDCTAFSREARRSVQIQRFRRLRVLRSYNASSPDSLAYYWDGPKHADSNGHGEISVRMHHTNPVILPVPHGRWVPHEQVLTLWNKIKKYLLSETEGGIEQAESEFLSHHKSDHSTGDQISSRFLTSINA